MKYLEIITMELLSRISFHIKIVSNICCFVNFWGDNSLQSLNYPDLRTGIWKVKYKGQVQSYLLIGYAYFHRNISSYTITQKHFFLNVGSLWTLFVDINRQNNHGRVHLIWTFLSTEHRSYMSSQTGAWTHDLLHYQLSYCWRTVSIGSCYVTDTFRFSRVMS